MCMCALPKLPSPSHAVWWSEPSTMAPFQYQTEGKDVVCILFSVLGNYIQKLWLTLSWTMSWDSKCVSRGNIGHSIGQNWSPRNLLNTISQRFKLDLFAIFINLYHLAFHFMQTCLLAGGIGAAALAMWFLPESNLLIDEFFLSAFKEIRDHVNIKVCLNTKILVLWL